MKTIKAFAIKNPKGEILFHTIRTNELSSIAQFTYINMNWDIGEKQGFVCVPVEIAEVKDNSEVEVLEMELKSIISAEHSELVLIASTHGWHSKNAKRCNEIRSILKSIKDKENNQ